MPNVELTPPRVEYGVTVDGIPVGKVGYVDNDNGTAHLDWYVDPSRRKQGIGAAAVEQMIQRLDETGRFTRYEALIRPRNTASFKLAWKCGFKIYRRTLENIYLEREAER